MGSGRWDSDAYTDASRTRSRTGVPDFKHTADVAAGRASGVHADLDPKRVAGSTSPLAGQCVRESRGSNEHPNSLPIAVFFDVTGSMGEIPVVLQKKLPSLMDVIIAKAGVADPNILFGAIGDFHSDEYPLQVGQFESDNRSDEQLRNIIIESGGGGQDMESYGLALSFAADHTATDAWEKRGKKGYLFTMGDEAFWPEISKDEIEKIFGIKVEKDESVTDIVARAKERWEIFHLVILEGSRGGEKSIRNRWRQLLGERIVMVANASLVCEIIA